jgi:TIR domain
VKAVLTMAHDVFISHSHEDKPAADAACAALEARGIRCWIAPRDINPGQDWATSIIKAIRGAQIMLLVFSRHANQSIQVRREVERAGNSGKVILPLRIDDVLPEEALEYYLSTPHWLDAITKPFEAHLEKLAAACDSLLDITGRSPQDPANPITGLSPSEKITGADRGTPAADPSAVVPSLLTGPSPESEHRANSGIPVTTAAAHVTEKVRPQPTPTEPHITTDLEEPLTPTKVDSATETGPRPVSPAPTHDSMWTSAPSRQRPPEDGASWSPESRAALFALSRRAFACVVAGVFLLSFAMVTCLVPWRGAPFVGSAAGCSWAFVIGTIPGVVLLVRGRGRAHLGQTIPGCALVSIGISTLFYLQVQLQPGWTLTLMLPAAAGLLLIVPLRQLPPTRAIAKGYLVFGAPVLVMAFINTCVLTVYRFAGHHFSGWQCGLQPVESISPDADPDYARSCGSAQQIVLQLQAIGAITGVGLVMAAAITWWSIHRSANDRYSQL